ncbi:MAG: glutamine--fructose-6-phosphate transaminase (isomerizing) [Candidatus Goldiibacteriota bacterium]
MLCGIIGYTGNKDAITKIISGLKKLEYRGYDSAGAAVIDRGGFIRHRAKGKIAALEKKIKNITIKGTTGIGHTRWATHGRPSEENAHPHIDSTGKITVVHNGIIENYLELRDELKKKGYKFISETDTEIFAHLISAGMKKGILAAVTSALKKVRGFFAIAVISTEEPDTIIAARNGSPLVAGIGKGENYIASDVTSFLKYTKKALFFEDGDVAVIKKDAIKVYNSGRKVLRKVKEIKWTHEQAEKGGFPHFMIKEIFEEPTAFEDTILGRFDSSKGEINFDGIKRSKIEKINNIRIIACGTSYYAALTAKYIIEKYGGINTVVDIGSEIRYQSPVIDKKTLIITVSQSGETTDTIAALNSFKKKAGYTIAVVNVVGSTLSRGSEGVIYTHAGPEIGVAATKTFLSQLAVLYLFAFYAGSIKKRLKKEDVKKCIRNMRKIPWMIKKILRDRGRIEKTAAKYYKQKDFLYYGRNVNYPIALEGALKLKEISYIHAEGYPAGEMKHGPIALVDNKVPNVFIAPQGKLYEKIRNNIEEIRARAGIIIAVTNRSNTQIKKCSDDVIYVPDIDEDYYPLTTVIPLQLLSYYIGVKKGIDVDKPRNLAKSVTVE